MDPYKILEIPKNSSLIDIKKAYKKLALKFHPDKNKENEKNEDNFKLIKEAYEFLITGKSSTGVFYKKEKSTKNKKESEPKEDYFKDSYAPSSEFFSETYPTIEVELEISTIFTGTVINIGRSGFYIHLLANTWPLPNRMIAINPHTSERRIFNTKFLLIKRDGYYLTNHEGKSYLAFNYHTTYTRLLAESEIFIKNANPNVGDIKINLSLKDKDINFIKVPDTGLPIKKGRAELLVYLKIDIIPLEKENSYTLMELEAKIKKILENKTL